ncbi:hypothetical protein C8R43DRAFT_821316, partial [Mycena crocata]
AVHSSLYQPLPARSFTPEEILTGLDQIDQQTTVQRLVDHPIGAIVKYSETGTNSGIAITHRFSVDAEDPSHPKASFQYSLGGSEGGRR